MVIPDVLKFIASRQYIKSVVLFGIEVSLSVSIFVSDNINEYINIDRPMSA